ncbi:hypothetical protein [Streptomyces mayteni]
MLTACGGGSDGEGDSSGKGGEPAGSSGGEPGSAEQGAPGLQLMVPGGYDTGAGWESDVSGTPLALPSAEAVAVFTGAETASGGFTVLDAATGETRWSSAPLRGIGGDAVLAALATTLGGQDYLVAWSVGADGGGPDTVSLDIFAADASGEGVEPTHHVEVEGDGEVGDAGGGLLVSGYELFVGVDPATGATTPYDPDALVQPNDCDLMCYPSGEIRALTPEGPLVANSDDGSFWVPDVWSSAEAAPEHALPDDPFVDLVADDLLVAQWSPGEGRGEFTWTVLNAVTGETLATVDCAQGYPTNDDYAARSANGRYVANGTRVFDLEEGTGRCFEGSYDTGTDTVTFSGLDDRGQAYGTLADTEAFEEIPVQVDIATGDTTELPAGTVFPLADLAGMGVFQDEDTQRLVAYAHAG